MYEKEWDDRQLSLGNPRCMDTPTLIEWIQRQLESPEETTERHRVQLEKHQAWHRSNPGIYACCIQTSTFYQALRGMGLYGDTGS